MKIHGKEIIYAGDDYYLVVFDHLNFAILDKEKADKYTTLGNCLLGYYGSLKESLMTLVKMKAEKNTILDSPNNLEQSHIQSLTNMMDRYGYIYTEVANKISKQFGISP